MASVKVANVNEFDGRTQWLIAGVVSLVLHVVGIGALLALNSPEKPPAVVEPQRPAATASPETSESGKAEPEKESAKSPTPPPAVRSGPAKDEKPVRDERPARTGTPEPKTRSENPAAVDTATYVVKSGDNLTKIARKHSLTAAELSKLNGKDEKTFSRLRVGQRIRVPRPDGE